MSPLPGGTVPFEDWTGAIKRRRELEWQQFLEEDAMRKRQREIDAELGWLDENKLFRGEAPAPGQDWESFVREVEERQRVRNERVPGYTGPLETYPEAIYPQPPPPPVPTQYDGVPVEQEVEVHQDVPVGGRDVLRPAAGGEDDPFGFEGFGGGATVSEVEVVPDGGVSLADIREERARYYMENHDAAVRDTRESPFGGGKKRKRKSPLKWLKTKIFKH